MSNHDLVVVMCPPYPEYNEQPKDQSKCDLFDCPQCKGKMWLSQKKKGMLMFAACLQKEIMLGCYNCIKQFVEENKESFSQASVIEI